MLHPGGAHYRPTGPGPGPCGTPRRNLFKFRRKWTIQRQFYRQWIVLYILPFVLAILPVVGSASTSAPSTATTKSVSPSRTVVPVNSSNTEAPFNKVAGSVLVCLGIPLISFVGLKLFVYLFPDCCKPSDFKRLWNGLRECFTGMCCPAVKTNVVAPTITKGISLLTSGKIKRRDEVGSDDVHNEHGENFLRMFLTLQKTKSEFRNLMKANGMNGKGSRRNSDVSVDTLDGQIITASVDNNDQFTTIHDKFRSASRSPTPPPHIVVIYPEDNTPIATPKPYEFQPIRTTENLDGQEMAQTIITPSEQNEMRADLVLTTPIPHRDDLLERSSTDIDVHDAMLKSLPLTKQQDNMPEIEPASSPRSATSGQSVPRHQTKMLPRSNTRNSMCVIKIELPERTEPDGMEAPIPERNEKDDSSFLTAGSTDYRGESDGGEDFHEVGEVDSFYADPDRQINVLVVQKPPSGDNKDENLRVQADHPERTSIVRRGSYGCEADDSKSCMTCEFNESQVQCTQEVASGDEADDDEDDVNSYYSISCPSSNTSPLTSELNTPQTSPSKRPKRIRQTGRSQEQRNVVQNPKSTIQDADLRKHIAKQRFQELIAAGENNVAVSLQNQKAGHVNSQQEVAVKTAISAYHRLQDQVVVTGDSKLPTPETNAAKTTSTLLAQEQNCRLSTQYQNHIVNNNKSSPQNIDHHHTNEQMADCVLPKQKNLSLEDHSLRLHRVNGITDTSVSRHDVTAPTQQQVTINDLKASEEKPTPESVTPTSHEDLAKESPIQTQSNSPGKTDTTVKTNISAKRNETVESNGNNITRAKSSPLRIVRKSSLQTGVYTGAARRTQPPKSRTYMSLHQERKSKSDLSRSSKSSSQPSNADPPSSSMPALSAQFGKASSTRPRTPERTMSKLTTLLKESSPKRESKSKNSPKKEASSPKKESLVSSFTYKKSTSNASKLYTTNKKGFKKLPGHAVAK